MNLRTLLVSIFVLSIALFASASQGQGFSPSIALADLDGTDGFTFDLGDIPGANAFTQNAYAAGGDINGDGVDDMVIGLAFEDPDGRTNAGTVFVVFGKIGGLATPVQIRALDGSNGFVLNGVSAGDNAGFSVDFAGDVNGDGIDDLLIGALSVAVNGDTNVGATYVVFGKTSPFAASIELSSIDGNNGFVLTGAAAGDRSGRSVARGGSVNGDNISDILIGAAEADPNGVSGAGETYVVFGKSTAFTQVVDLGTLDGTNGFTIEGTGSFDLSGGAVASAGDVNNDGKGDIIIGAARTDPNGKTEAGSSYVIFGHSMPFDANFALSSLNGTNGFTINGVASGDRSGDRVHSAGDINKDGFDDVLIGAGNADPNGLDRAGAAYVIYGKDSIFNSTLELSALAANAGLSMGGLANTDLLASVSTAGDINSDGVDDFIVGAAGADPASQSNAGTSYIVFGKIGPLVTPFDLATLNGANGFAANGNLSLENSGSSVVSAGDVNGDGVDDILIGGGKRFASHVVYGKAISTGATTIFSSVLPAARGGFIGGPAITVFANAVNAGSERAQSCAFVTPVSAPVTVQYQETGAGNVVTGRVNKPFFMNPNQSRSFILSFTPTATSSGADVFPNVECNNGNVTAIPSVNTVFLSIDNTPVPDILSIGATPNGLGIIDVPRDNASFMSASTTNIGVGDTGASKDVNVTVTVDDGGVGLPVLIQLCETDSLGTCLNPPSTNPVITTIGSGPSFFGVFVFDQNSGGVALDAATKRVFLRFTDSGGTVRSVTSAAIQVQ